MDGDFALAGSPGDDTAGHERRRGLSLRQDRGRDRRLGRGDQKLVAADAAAGDLFGDRGRHLRATTPSSGPPARTAPGPTRALSTSSTATRAAPTHWGQVSPPRGRTAPRTGTTSAVRSPSTATTVVVGAEGVAGDTDQEGAAYVFLKDQGGAGLLGPGRPSSCSDDPGNTDQYGYSVALDGRHRRSSAPRERTGRGATAARSASTPATSAARTPGAWSRGSAPPTSPDDSWFGTAVAIRGRPGRRRGPLGRRRRDQPRRGLRLRPGRGRRGRLGPDQAS
ncbi:MAG: hypothetical protein M0C28_01620 [Candidatus Moduliflexus flocculans]|nr:hypothetical protein [Candidatus Moduliflexus flocculans]